MQFLDNETLKRVYIQNLKLRIEDPQYFENNILLKVSHNLIYSFLLNEKFKYINFQKNNINIRNSFLVLNKKLKKKGNK